MKDYIEWRYQPTDIVDSEDIKSKIEELDSLGAGHPESKTILDDWLSYTYAYRIEKGSKWSALFFMDRDQFGYPILHIWRCNAYKSKDEYAERKDRNIRPVDCKNEIVRLFKKHCKTSLCRAFKPISYEMFHNCVPKPAYYIDRDLCCADIYPAHLIDVSSMYPAAARGRMPDAHTALIMQGYHKPTAEYPFAFYLKSNHCAEYGVFDTHDYLNLPDRYAIWQMYTIHEQRVINIYSQVDDRNEVTVLMKKSRWELTQVFEEIYQRKNAGDPMAKAVSNIGIGTLHKNPENNAFTKGQDINDYYHLAAVILGRANKQQYDMIDKIESAGGVVLQGIVDSLIYYGDFEFGTTEKQLGEYYNEFGKPIHYRGSGINKYVLYDDEKNILKFVVSGVKKGEQIIEKPEDIDIYGKDGD